MARQNRNRVGIPQVTDEQIATAFSATGVSGAVEQTVAERSGSDDKVEAVKAENAPPKVKTYTVEGREWIDRDPYGLKLEGRYGKKGKLPINPEDMQRHAQARGIPNDAAECELIHSLDATAPDYEVVCPICNKPVQKTELTQTALIDFNTGDLVRDEGVIRYRGHFVAVGPDPMNLPVHGAHAGECMFRLRLKRDRNGNVIFKTITPTNGGRPYEVPDLLPCHNFAQANARAAAVRLGLQAKRDARTAEENRMKTALGFKVGDAARQGGNHTDDGIDRGSFAPKIPRGQSRKQRRWVEDTVDDTNN